MKCAYNAQPIDENGRSREGAWIEIKTKKTLNISITRRSREGAWIEIATYEYHRACCEVAPARERGLKFGSAAGAIAGGVSLPRGSVD